MTETQPIQTRPTYTALVFAILWAIAAVIIGFHFITSTPDAEYGGDAYTGIQQAAAQTARAVGFLVIGTGVLGLVIANSGRRTPL